MLAKMGWEEGKGLGAKLQGNPEFVRVKYKSDADGFGYEDRNDQWTKNEDGFNKLLSSLNQQQPVAEDVPRAIKSLEEKSEQSRVRVHYKKRIACKDLSKRSAKDLANIFGKKSLEDEPQPEEQKASNDSTE
jgi:Pin2-interacting protein X1